MKNKGIDVADTIAVDEVLSDYEVSAKDPFRLDSEAEECVKIIVEELNKTVEKILWNFNSNEKYTLHHECCSA